MVFADLHHRVVVAARVRARTIPALAAAALLVSAGTRVAGAQFPAQNTARPQAIPRSGAVPVEASAEQKLLTSFKAPPGFKASLFAGPPVAMYPTCVNESPDGAVFVCVDPNLSLSTIKGVGRVMRLVDTDGDGHADKYTTFAEMDSPRGVVSDGKTVYVMHPPMLTAYRDTNGDGIADESTDIVTGLGFDLDFRGADHTTNNVELGPDGWLYVAVGDYGFIRAVGTDGRQIQHRGGAVVRVRPDGSNLEIVAVGTRNIYDVAIDPFGRVYARDNTNDGDGWDTRLHYLAPGANMGYPIKYQNFKTEHFPTLADYGPGAGVGSLWLQDPAW
ncbi:MAG: PQQ-dependent sugar dehydrogenase, partial [bacterium]